MNVPGWEGTVGPFRADYRRPHVYARDITSGAGNCVCGSDLGAWLHVQAAPGVPVPDGMRYGHRPSYATQASGYEESTPDRNSAQPSHDHRPDEGNRP